MANKIVNARDHSCESLINQSLYVFPMSSFAVVSRVPPITSSLSVVKRQREREGDWDGGRKRGRKKEKSKYKESNREVIHLVVERRFKLT